VRVKKKPVQPTEPGLSLGLRRYLYISAAITGAAIMIVEILGAKILSPYFGTSHFVWTAQIAVTLVALACGYYAGGWLVDRSLKLGRLYAAILIAGLYLAVTVAVREPVAYACLKFRLASGSLLASTILFFVPLSLLAMVGPFVVRVLTSSVANVGGNVGRLTALSTLGSFVGTVLIGYVLIPYLPNSVTMYLTALLLMLISVTYLLGWGRASSNVTATVVAVALGIATGYHGVRRDRWQGTSAQELFRGNSNFGQLQVLQYTNSSGRLYLNDYLTQNTYDTNEQKSMSMFTYMLHGLARAYVPHIDRVLCIGLGIGVVPMTFAREGARVDVAEINPAVIPVAKAFFDLDPSRLNIFIGDGRYFVNATTNDYDAIILDAFLGDSCPSHLMTREAFGAMRRVLRPDGALVINTFADVRGENPFFSASLYKTLTNCFPSVRLHAGPNGNTLFVASLRSPLEFAHRPDVSQVHRRALQDVKDAFSNLREVDTDRGCVLTDDFNPVEFYDAANREALRRDLAFGVKRL
jgi:spermidine synthase